MMLTMYDPFSGNMYGFDTSVITSLIAIDCYTKSEIDSKLSAVLKLCGQKATASQLPKSGNEVGDVWIVEDEEAEYAWIKSLKWERLGPILDLTSYATTNYVNTLVGTIPSVYNSVVAYIEAVASVANSALPAATFNSFVSTNSQAVAAAKKAGDDAKTGLDNFKTAQLVFEATVQEISALIDSSTKVATTDTNFSRRKTYYKLEGGEYVALVRGTDYEAMESIADFGITVYEQQGFSVSAIISKVNELVAAGNSLISAHKQAAVEVVE